MSKTSPPKNTRIHILTSRIPRRSAAPLAASLSLLLGVHQAASAAVITLQQAPSGTLSTYTESGFALSAVSGPWIVTSSYGNPAPFIQFINYAGQSATTATIQITSSGSLFTFGSVDLYSSVTPIPYAITGLLNAAPVFSLEGTLPNTFGAFRTLSNPSTNYLIDSLSISLTNPALSCCSNPMGLDNIVVTPASQVPEPSALPLVLSGLLVITWLRRRDANPQE